ncbi:MAG TPA: protein-L-isoaspartate(D-aspartate) O-methyltransferase [Vicinamibacterales bacterium]|nr:protein-L-isoaspartate(D-aspartate) O-methyltransferase [Vicinamibacterales bacterium]
MFTFELLALVYFLLLPAAALLTRRARPRPAWRAMAAAAILAVVILVAARVLSPAARAWLGHLYLVAGYWIPGLMAPAAHDARFESWLETTDRRWQSRLSRIPEWLVHAGDVGYLLCYPSVPAAFLVVWWSGGELDVNRFWFAVLLAGFTCYGSLPWLVARPPRPLPGAGAHAHPVARVNTALLSRVSHNLTTFPSGHVAVSVAAALCVATLSLSAGLALLLVAAAVSIGAVAGRYHYVVDVAAGFLVGAVSVLVAVVAPPDTRRLAATQVAAAPQRANDSYDQRRIEMVERQLASRGVASRPVLDAMREVPRERFVPPDLASRAYDDRPLPIGLGQTISQPYIVAYMSELLRTTPEHRVLEVGTGSGYQAAVLGELVREVYTIEIVPELARRATAVLKDLGYRNVQVREGDGYAGWPDRAPFDRILVTAAPERIPQPLLDQLAPGGVLVAPVGQQGTTQWIVVAEKTERGIVERRTIPVQFVPFTRPK